MTQNSLCGSTVGERSWKNNPRRTCKTADYQLKCRTLFHVETGQAGNRGEMPEEVST